MTDGGANPSGDQSYVIVAIPDKSDPVWKVSSEKIPHMTLLYLGDHLDNVDQVIDYVGHAVETTLTPFALPIARRGLLGDKDADVLFFEENNVITISALKNFRTYLLNDENISKAYASADQFPSWTPHLTLGYPSAPAKGDHHDAPGWMLFESIALWTGDFEGVEFPLKSPFNPDLAMTDVKVSELAHYGVKGMKWGKHTPATGRDIKDARGRIKVASKAYLAERKQLKGTTAGSAEQLRIEKRLQQMHQDYLKNPDRVLATRMTRGEKILTLWQGAESPVTAGVSLAAIAGTSIASRRIEFKQQHGLYNKASGKPAPGHLNNDMRVRRLALAGAGALPTLIQNLGPTVTSSILSKAATNRAAAAAAAKATKPLAIGSTAAKVKFAKKTFGGVHKITSMK
jgi:2'-5' RNA ligase